MSGYHCLIKLHTLLEIKDAQNSLQDLTEKITS
jgi:hypothetical protein